MWKFVLSLIISSLVACGKEASVPVAGTADRTAIKPSQFAVVPCISNDKAKHLPCYLLAAGGKYYLMGAPETALSQLRDDEVRLLDGVLLFSLLPSHVDGLDSIRHITWKNGRSEALLVAGPEGVIEFSKAIDSAFEVPDAEFFARESPRGGFDASLLSPREIVFGTDAGSEVVDTGDLQIRGFYAPSGQIIYLASYENRSAAIGMCGAEEDLQLLVELSGGGAVIACNDRGETIYVVQ